MSQKVKQHFYISDETKASHERADVPRHIKKLYELKSIKFKAGYATSVAMCKRLTRIYITIYYYIYDVYECIYL